MPTFNPNEPRGVLLLMELALYGFIVLCFLLCVLCISYVIYDSQGVIFLGGYIPNAYFFLPVRLAVIIFHAYMYVMIFSGIASMGGILIAYMFYMFLLISRELRISSGIKHLSLGTFRSSQNVRTFYRAIQIVQHQILYTCNFGVYILLINAVCMKTGIYFTFTLLRYWGRLKLVTKAPMVIGDLMCVGYWVFLLQMGCLFYVGCKKTLISWQRHNWGFMEQIKLMRRFHRSCRPIVFSYGSQFVMGRKSVLKFFRGVSRGTCRALLATK